jgi:hypothetical protein
MKLSSISIRAPVVAIGTSMPPAWSRTSTSVPSAASDGSKVKVNTSSPPPSGQAKEIGA